MARPTKYTEQKADAICALIATTSLSMKSICEKLDFPVGSVLRWLDKEKTFREKYARAKEQQADFMAEEIIEIADDGTNDYMTIQKGNAEYNVENKEVTNRSRLRVDARKWVAAKLKPKKYGERLDVTSGGETINHDFSKLSNDELVTLAKLQSKIDGISENQTD